jgi:hypothetical protein
LDDPKLLLPPSNSPRKASHDHRAHIQFSSAQTTTISNLPTSIPPASGALRSSSAKRVRSVVGLPSLNPSLYSLPSLPLNPS